MTKQELRKNLIDFFEEKEIDYDGSQNTMTLYRWASRKHGFIKVDEFEKKSEPKTDFNGDEKPMLKIVEKTEVKNEKEKPEKIVTESGDITEIIVMKEKQKQPEKQPEKQTEKEPEKEENIWLWVGLAAVAIAVILIINHYANGKDNRND